MRDREELMRFAIMGSILPAATTFKRREALQIGGYRPIDVLERSEDFDLHIRFINRYPRFSIILKPLINKYLHRSAQGQDKRLCFYSGLKAIRLLKDELPGRYHKYLSEYCIVIGSQLYLTGAKTEAQEAFDLAYLLGKPGFILMRPRYRLCASLIGPWKTERLTEYYRKIVPACLRKAFYDIKGLFCRRN